MNLFFIVEEIFDNFMCFIFFVGFVGVYYCFIKDLKNKKRMI